MKINLNKIFYPLFIVVLLWALFATQCSNKYKEEVNKLEYNITAYKDTVSNIILDNGKIQKEKDIAVETVKTLKENNSELYAELKVQDGKVLNLTKTIIILEQDKNILNDEINYLIANIDSTVQLDDDSYMLPWKLEYQWDESNYDIFQGETYVDLINGVVIHKNTKLIKRVSNIDLTFGNKTVDDKFMVFVNSKYPGFDSSNLNSVLIDPNENKNIKDLMKKKKWFNGWSAGVYSGYDVISRSIYIGPGIGYTIYNW